jgi:hypothetical protein
VDSDNSRSRVISSATSFCVSALWSSNIISSHTSLWPVLLSFVTHGNVCIENVAAVGSVWDSEGGGVENVAAVGSVWDSEGGGVENVAVVGSVWDREGGGVENVAVVGSVWDREGGGVNSGDSAEGASGTFVCGSVVRGVASVYVCDAVAFVSTPVILFV